MNLLLILVSISSLVLLLILTAVSTFLLIRLSSMRKSLDTSCVQSKDATVAVLAELELLQASQSAENQSRTTQLDTLEKKVAPLPFQAVKTQKAINKVLLILEALSPAKQPLSPFPLGETEEEQDIKQAYSAQLITINSAQQMLEEAGLDPTVALQW
jgi:hypothetical protein